MLQYFKSGVNAQLNFADIKNYILKAFPFLACFSFATQYNRRKIR